MIKEKEIVLSTNKNVVKQILALSSYVPKITRLIHECPGITHGDLAKKAKLEINHLSNIMKRLENREAVSSVKTGRDKHYYLSSSGEDALVVANYFDLDPIKEKEINPKETQNDDYDPLSYINGVRVNPEHALNLNTFRLDASKK